MVCGGPWRNMAVLQPLHHVTHMPWELLPGWVKLGYLLCYDKLP